MRTSTRLSFFALLAFAAACSVQDTKMPDLAGPSELGLRLNPQITPDSILQDGASQASLTIDASNYNGQPARGVSLRVETMVDGALMDYGTLSAKTIVTGDDGKARLVYTAPPRPSQPVDQFNVVTFRVYPMGGDFTGETARTVTLRLVTPGVILPPNPTAPEPRFTYAPSAPAIDQSIVFDASQTLDDGAACGAACTYSWDFGDGNKASGIFTNHKYSKAATYQVRLTVTDARGASGTIAQAVTIGGGTPPTAAFAYSPTQPQVSQLIHFTAEASRPATGRTIVSYEWNFGSGRTGTGMTISKGYDTPGTYQVTLTVTDDAGVQGTVAQSVTVGNASPLIASLTATQQPDLFTFFFNANGSRSPNPIIEYVFDFGDGSPTVRTTDIASTTHTYTRSGTWVASVRVRDNAGRSHLTSVSISIP